jgi:type II secretory pathway component PulK
MILKIFSPFRWRDRSGSVLILAFWALGLLSVFAVYMGYAARVKLSLARRVHEYAMLRHIAKSGIAKFQAKFKEADENGATGLSRTISIYRNFVEEDLRFGRGRFIVDVFDCERSLNINTAPVDILARLIEDVCSVADGDARAAAEAIIDWRDADSSPQAEGAEDSYYNSLPEPYDAKDAFFNETDELLLVRGFTGKMMEKLSPFVTVCGDGAVNINSAPPQVLGAIGLDKQLVDKILQYRAGEDDLLGTEDDPGIVWTSAFVFSEPDLITLTPVEEEALRKKAEEGLLGSRISYLDVTSRAFLAGSTSGGYAIHAVYRVQPKEDGTWNMKLEFWRTRS